MKVTIPEHLGDINLFQYQRYMAMTDKHDLAYKVHIFIDLPLEYCKAIKLFDLKRLSKQIDQSLQFSTEFTHKFTMKDIEFGFIPNLDKITVAEYIDLQSYANGTENLHRFMAILFRPIYKNDGENYAIMPYNGTEDYAQIMLHTPMNIVNGALVFFYNLTNELQERTHIYLTNELMKDLMPKSTSRFLAGMLRLKRWLKIMYLKLTRF